MGAPTVALFDVDGTLVDTGGAGGRSWRAAFQELYGIPGDITRFSEVGMTDLVVARDTFAGTLGRDPADTELTALIAAYVRGLPDEVARSKGYRVLPGVAQLLDRLSRAGVVLGLVSGNVEGAARIKIGRADLNRFFPFGGYATDSGDRSELTRAAIARAEALAGEPLDPARVFVVGDTPRDVDAAHGAGAVAVAVATGSFPAETLATAGADHVLGTLEEPFPADG